MNLVVKLIGGAKDAQSSMAGTYILGPDKVNQRSHWLQDPGTMQFGIIKAIGTLQTTVILVIVKPGYFHLKMWLVRRKP